MSDYRNFGTGETRSPTWHDRDVERAARERGISDVYVAPEDAPQEFWNVVALAAESFTFQPNASDWERWSAEFGYLVGFTTFDEVNYRRNFLQIVRTGTCQIRGYGILEGIGYRLSAIELMLDLLNSYSFDFSNRINDSARRFRVGLEIENRRFVPVSEKHIHEEIVTPTLLLLSNERFRQVDSDYRAAFDRALRGDFPGSITVAMTAVEQMLHDGLGAQGNTLDQCLQSARSAQQIGTTDYAILSKLMTLRDGADAHANADAGFDDAMFAIHLVGSVLLHLGRSALASS